MDTGYRKPLDLQVVTAVDDFRNLPGDSVWPTVIPAVLGEIMRHRSTLIFANNRRLAERTADRLNAQIAAERSEEVPPGSTEVLAPGGMMRDRGIFAIGAEGPIQRAPRQHLKGRPPQTGGGPEGGPAARAGGHQLA